MQSGPDLTQVFSMIDKIREPNQIMIELMVGRAFLLVDDFSTSLRIFQYIKDRHSSIEFEYYQILGNMAYSLTGLGRYDDAISQLLYLKELADDGKGKFFAWHVMALANAYCKKSQMSESEKWIQVAERMHEYREGLSWYKQLYPCLAPVLEAREKDSIEERALVISDNLKNLPAGNEFAADFHNTVLRALELVFYPSLTKPTKEQRIHEGRKRVDIMFNNSAARGFFHDLRVKHNVYCPYIIFECKNYASDPKNPDIDQLSGRFGPLLGDFGVMVCREIQSHEILLQRCKDVVLRRRGYILVLDDRALLELLRYRIMKDHAAISDYLEDQFKRLLI